MQIFIFNLPFSNLSDHFPCITSYLLRNVHRNGHHRRVFSKDSRRVVASDGTHSKSVKAILLARSQALTAGPSLAECKKVDSHNSNSDSIVYGPSVLARARSRPAGNWNQRIRLYQEGLAYGPWMLNLQDFDIKQIRKSDLGDGALQKFKCPATILFGLEDIALNPQLALNGTENYFADHQNKENGINDSHVIRLKSCGHWSFLEPTGAVALEDTILWLLKSDTSGDTTIVDTNHPQNTGLRDFLLAAHEDILGDLSIETYKSHN